MKSKLLEELDELANSLGIKKEKEQEKNTKEITFWNDYSLDINRPARDPNNPYAEDVARKKTVKVDFNNERQLFNIIKNRKEFTNWRTSRSDRRDILNALNDIG